MVKQAKKQVTTAYYGSKQLKMEVASVEVAFQVMVGLKGLILIAISQYSFWAFPRQKQNLIFNRCSNYLAQKKKNAKARFFSMSKKTPLL